MSHSYRATAVAVVALICRSALAADTIESVEKKIIEHADKVKSMSAKMKTDVDMNGQGMKMTSKSEGIYEYARRGDKLMLRMESKSAGTSKFGDHEQKTEEKGLMVADGEFFYTYTEGTNGKRAVKLKQDPQQLNAAGKRMFENLRKDYELKLLPDEKIENQQVWVIQATPKKPRDGIKSEKHTYCFRQDNGVLVKSLTESEQEQGKSTILFTLTEVKLNPDLSPDRFTFKAPEGVTVMDMTQQTAEPQEAAPSESADADPPRKSEEKKAEPEPAKDQPKKKEKRSLVPKIKNPFK